MPALGTTLADTKVALDRIEAASLECHNPSMEIRGCGCSIATAGNSACFGSMSYHVQMHDDKIYASCLMSGHRRDRKILQRPLIRFSSGHTSQAIVGDRREHGIVGWEHGLSHNHSID